MYKSCQDYHCRQWQFARVNSRFYRFLWLSSSNQFLMAQIVSSISLLKSKGSLGSFRGLPKEERFVSGVGCLYLWTFQIDPFKGFLILKAKLFKSPLLSSRRASHSVLFLSSYPLPYFGPFSVLSGFLISLCFPSSQFLRKARNRCSQ